MKNYLNLNLSALSFILIAGCANLSSSPKISSNIVQKTNDATMVYIGPDIPMPQDAFYPIHSDLDGVYYSWDDCKFFGLSCKHKEAKYLFNDKAMQAWFKSNDFGYCKRPKP